MWIESVMLFYRVENRMSELLYLNFRGYLRSNLSEIKWVFVFALFFLALFYFLFKKRCAKNFWGLVLLSFNCAFIFVMTLFGRAMGETYRYTLVPFESYFVVITEGDMEILLQILMNIAMYIPLGLLLPRCFTLFERYRYIFLVAVISSVGIELVQGIFRLGLFEVDDIINNTLGSMIGMGIYALFHRFKNSTKVERRLNMNNLKPHQMQLLDLVSFALFGGEKCEVPLTFEVLKEASQQAVLTLMEVQGDTSRGFYLMHAQMLANNVRVNYEHAEAHHLMMQAEVPYVILKGSASASYYPEPLFRCMGDVDLLIAKSDLPKVDVILRENGFLPVEGNKHECHLAYHREVYDVVSRWEVHWSPGGIPKGDVGQRIRSYLEDIIASAEHSNIFAEEYMVPTVFHHGLIMLLHVAGHLINTGIGLRHLCDWAVFVAKFSDEEFCELFEDKLKAVGLWRFAQLLTQLSMKYLHCPAKEWCGVGDDEYLTMMMVDIMNSGNFGVKDKNRINQLKLMPNTRNGKMDDRGLLKQFIFTMNRKSRSDVPITAKVPLLLPIGWMYVGGRHLVYIMQGKRPGIRVKDMIAGAAERKEIYKEFRLFEPE